MAPPTARTVAQQQAELDRAIAVSLKDADAKIGHANILIAGASNAGKTELALAIFDRNLRDKTAKTTELTEHPGEVITLFDTRGLERKQFEETKRIIMDEVQERRNSSDPSTHMHMAWFCIDDNNLRLDEGDLEVISALAWHMPVIVVITKAWNEDNDDDRNSAFEACEAAGAKKFITVIAKEKRLGGFSCGPSGLNVLVRATLELLGQAQKCAFAAAQTYDLQTKRIAALQVCDEHCGAIFNRSWAQPLPFYDQVHFSRGELDMFSLITKAFGTTITCSDVKEILGIVAANRKESRKALWVAGNVTKCIPLLGWLVGGGMSAVANATDAYKSGELYIDLLSGIHKINEGKQIQFGQILAEFKQKCQ